MSQKKWSNIAIKKRDDVSALIPHEWRITRMPSREEQRDVTGTYLHQFLTSREIEITETDAVGIAQKVQSGAWTALETVKSFSHRAALAHQLTNCLLEVFFEQAYSRAQYLDDYYATHKERIGPLHGVPISLKDQFHVKGVETTMGYVGWVGTFEGQTGTGKEQKFESEMVKELMDLGAVFYVKTSVPHTLMSPESVNNIMGYIWNPKNRLLSAGGSSGGEGALIAMRGSPLGFGTDIGGSIRVPAAFNGLFGLRPSVGRLPYEGMANSMDGQNTILSVVGPLATTAASLQMVVRAILSKQPWFHDPLVIELPWRDAQEQEVLDIIGPAIHSNRRLCFGRMVDDGTTQIHPPVRRAVEIVTNTMEKLGHKVIDWQPPDHAELFKVAMKSWFIDGAKDIHEAFGLSGEPPTPQIEGTFGTKSFEPMKGPELFALNKRKRELQKEYLEFWNSTVNLTGTGRPVDAVISPLAPYACAIPETYKHIQWSIWVNALDYTSVVIPVTNVDKGIDKKYENFKPLSDKDREINEIYDPDTFDGAPVAIQLVGRRLQEEKMLALAKYVGDCLNEEKRQTGMSTISSTIRDMRTVLEKVTTTKTTEN